MKSVALVATLLFAASSANAKWTTPKACGKGEVFSTCHSYCERTCTTPKFIMCPAACLVGCGCKKGYVRDKASGECIPKTLCGVIPMKSADEDSEPMCGKGEVFSTCHSTCEPTCTTPNIRFCNRMCKVGCSCKRGYVRDEASGECIPKMLCGVVPMSDDEDSLGYARNNAPFNTFA